METIYFAGGCLWGVQAFMKTIPGVIATQAGRANGSTHTLDGPYDGYAECVKTTFDPSIICITQLISCFFEIIDPYSINQQGADIGEKYRTGIYSLTPSHLQAVHNFINQQADKERIVVEILPLHNYVKSAPEHQDRLERCPHDYCHISTELLSKYK